MCIIAEKIFFSKIQSNDIKRPKIAKNVAKSIEKAGENNRFIKRLMNQSNTIFYINIYKEHARED